MGRLTEMRAHLVKINHDLAKFEVMKTEIVKHRAAIAQKEGVEASELNEHVDNRIKFLKDLVALNEGILSILEHH